VIRVGCLLIVPLLGAVLAGASSATPVFVVSGAGHGHGVGLSQYGAYGQAQHGASYEAILARYYPGTRLASVSPPAIRVLLVSGNPDVTITSKAEFTVTDAAGATYQLPPGPIRLGRDLVVELADGARTLNSPARFVPGASALELGVPYRGSLVVSRVGDLLRVVNELPVEQYLYGVVPGEMPAHWAPEALKAQAVAARSYALATRDASGPFDVHPDTRDQVYGGIRREDARTTAAVDATAGQVLLYGDSVATTYFSASSGGRTVAAEDAWPGARPVPYLVSVEDPEDEISPHHRWGPIVLPAPRLAEQLGEQAPAGIRDVLVSRNGSGRASAITVVGSAAATEVDAPTVRSLLGLRSTAFSFGVVDVRRPDRPGRYGSQAVVTGLARGIKGAVLEGRGGDGVWRPLAVPETYDDGSFAVGIPARERLELRLTAPVLAQAGVSAPRSTLVVVAAVRLERPRGRSRLRGQVRPKRDGVPVEIQALRRGEWRTVAAATTGRSGRFAASLRVRAGAYRAVARPGAGVAPGVSGVVRVAP
jgi:stage II sporulation protein D